MQQEGDDAAEAGPAAPVPVAAQAAAAAAAASTGAPPDAATASVLPVAVWGLDPLFSANVRLFVKQVHELIEMPGVPEVYLLHTHPVLRVAVMGVVVLVDRRLNRTTYCLDDGTGLLRCTQFQSAGEPFALGDTITAHGRLSTYRGRREMTIAGARRVQTVGAEMLWWLDVCRLTRDVYSLPAKTFVDAARRRRGMGAAAGPGKS